jgi:hypothetical protein
MQSDATHANQAYDRHATASLNGSIPLTDQANPIDLIWQHPRYRERKVEEEDNRHRGLLFLGNAAGAKNARLQQENKITAIVNCCGMKNLMKDVAYFNFDIGAFHNDSDRLLNNANVSGERAENTSEQKILESAEGKKNGRGNKKPLARKGGGKSQCSKESGKSGDEVSILSFFCPFFGFVDEKLASGQNVLIHCQAGAHRAGSAGIAYLMWAEFQNGLEEGTNDSHAGNADFHRILEQVKAIRPVVDPSHHKQVGRGVEEHTLADLLKGLEKHLHKVNI